MYSWLSKIERLLFAKKPKRRHPRLWALLFVLAGCAELVGAYLEARRPFLYPLSLLFFGVGLLAIAGLYVTPSRKGRVVLGLRVLITLLLLMGIASALLVVFLNP